jgi:plastocyanin
MKMTLRRYWLLAAVVTAALAVAGIGSAATTTAAAKSVKGTVGPGFTIRLTANGKKVTKLRPRTPYRFVIDDRSSSHDFHLRGPGLNRVFTSVGFVGKKSYTLTLKKGAYRFFCDPHASFMHGAFTVG